MRLLFNLFFIVLLVPSCNRKVETEFVEQVLLQNEQFIPGDVKQLLLVFNESIDNHEATLVALEETKRGWQLVSESIPAGIGRNGFANIGEKKEGDGKSPSGLFELGHLYSYEINVETKMPYTQSSSEDKWIDDPESPDYNRFIRGATNARSYENLKLSSIAYKYCMVIEYNTNPVIKGNGSAIFFHLNKQEHTSTAGCVAVLENEMQTVLKWMNPESNPMILMGNKKVLLSGVGK